ncbi:MAG: hypothetical protein HOW73_34280 [Polyangiaceae bacterium]|nr:hypothetical protein [Polyangiaceae bacterium]
MNARSIPVLAVFAALPLATGCASRTAPFNNLDDASMTILKLEGNQAAANPLTGGGGFPIPIPGLTPEQQQQMQQSLGQIPQQLQQMIPGLPQIPGLPGSQPAAPKFNGYTILGTSYGDDDMKDEVLDLFGDEDSFNQNRGQCFTPGMAFVFTPADGSPNVELMVSFGCNQAVGNGFQWPYPNNGLTTDSGNTLRNIYQKAFGQPPPPSGA